MSVARIVVAAGLIRRPGADRVEGPFLLSRRPQGVHLAGQWEFPGGKVEPGEDPPSALVRELREELGVEVRVEDVFAVGHHRYPERDVVLLVYECVIAAGEPRCLEVAELRWLSGSALVELPLPPADRPVVERLARALAGERGR